MIGGAKYVSIRVCERVPNGVGVAKPRTRREPLVCELGLLERRLAKLEVDEDYGEALQMHARARLGGARRQNAFLLKCKAIA